MPTVSIRLTVDWPYAGASAPSTMPTGTNRRTIIDPLPRTARPHKHTGIEA
jgi:hypothetical protein